MSSTPADSGQIGDFIHSTATALSGREGDVRELISRLDTFVGTVDEQRDRFTASIQALNRLTTTLATQKDDITDALHTIPPPSTSCCRSGPDSSTALQKLGQFSDTATELVNTTQDDLVRNLTNLEPTLKALADVGPQLDTVLAFLPTFPFSQNFIDRAIRGDYVNIFATMDLTIPRLKRSLFLGTRWGDPNAPLIPAPGDPTHLNYTYEPLSVGVTSATARTAIRRPHHLRRLPPHRREQPLLPVTPPPRPAAGPVVADLRRTLSPGSGQLMLTRFVRTQLVVFTIASVIGLTAMIFGYLQVPTWLGVGHITVTAGAAGDRRALPVRQRHLPRRADREGRQRRRRPRPARPPSSPGQHRRRFRPTCRPTCAACPRSASSTST